MSIHWICALFLKTTTKSTSVARNKRRNEKKVNDWHEIGAKYRQNEPSKYMKCWKATEESNKKWIKYDKINRNS